MVRKVNLFLSLPILYSIFFSGCFDTPKDPVLPNWDVELNVPITQRTYKLSEIIKRYNNPNLSIVDSTGSESLYVYMINNLHSSAPITDSIKVPVNLVPEDLDISGLGTGNNDLIYGSTPYFRLDTAEFKSGSLFVKLQNNGLNASITYELSAPGFKKKTDGSILKLTGVLSPGQDKTIEVSLYDYIYTQLKKYIFNTDSTQRKDGILIRGKATTTGNENIDFRSQVTNNAITLSRMAGKIIRIDLGYNEQEFPDVFGKETRDFSSKIKFKSLRINLQAITTGSLRNLKVIVDSLSVNGYNILPNNNYGSPYFLKILGNDYYTTTLKAGVPFDTTYDENNTSIIDFLSKFPDLIKVRSKFIIDNIDPNSSGSISDKDSVRATVNLAAPIIIKVAGAGFSDTSNVDISEKDRDEIIKSNSAKLTIEVENHIAIGLLAKCILTDINYNPLFSLRNSEAVGNDVFEILPAAIDNNGIPSQPSTTKLTCILNKEEFQKFKDAEYVIIDLKLHSTGSTSTEFGPFVQIRAKDFVKFKIYGGVNYRLDPEGNK